MNNFAVLAFVVILGNSCDATCDSEGKTLYDNCQILVKSYMKDINAIRERLPPKFSQFTEKLGFFGEKEWNVNDAENMLMSLIEEIRKCSKEEIYELVEEYGNTHWYDLFGKDSSEELKALGIPLKCCLSTVSNIIGEFKSKVGLFISNT